MTLTIVTEPILRPILDTRSEAEILDHAKKVTYEASGRTINDFSPSNPLTALLEGQVFAQAELAYYLNKLPAAMAIEFLKGLSIERAYGSKAVATLTYTLTGILGTVFTLPLGYKVFTESGLEWATTAVSSILPGNLTGQVAVECSVTGSIGNVLASTITKLSVPLSFLSSVTNLAAASGGSDPETDAELWKRTFTVLNTRSPVTDVDYQLEIKANLGSKAPVYVTSSKFGKVDCYVLDSSGNDLNTAQLNDLRVFLQGRSLIGIIVSVANLGKQPVNTQIKLKFKKSEVPDQTNALTLAKAVRDYFLPGFIVGSVIPRDLEAMIRTLPFVESIQELVLNGLYACNDQLLLTNKFTTATPGTLSLNVSGNEIDYDLATLS